MRRGLLTACTILALTACDRLPGRPRDTDRPLRPAQVMDFTTLYGEHCAGCHGDEHRPGAAVGLTDPTYLALIDGEVLRRVIADGVPGTAMPGFAEGAGGPLTEPQVALLAREMRGRWGRPGVLGDGTPPAYAAAPGDPDRGAQVYAAFCASCHGPSGRGGTHGGSIVDGAYLALVSDQGLRTAVLVGRPGLGMPDWRGDDKDRPMAAEEVADVVAWLIARRPQFPGQPDPTPEAPDG